jgi:hypothetical protein
MKEKKIRMRNPNWVSRFLLGGKIRMRPDGLLEGVREERKCPSWGAGVGPCLLLALAMSGCARVAPPPAPRPVMVEVPVSTPIYCQVSALQPPALAIAALTPDSPPADTVRSYAASVEVLKSAVRERDAILAGCAAPAPEGDAAGARASVDSEQGGSAGVKPLPTRADSRRPLLGQGEVRAGQGRVQSRLVSTLFKLVSWW